MNDDDTTRSAASALSFTTSVDGIDEAAFGGGSFDGWAWPPSLEEHLALLRGSSHVALALDGDRVVGFAVALHDGILSAYIPLLEVLPAATPWNMTKTRTRAGDAIVNRPSAWAKPVSRSAGATY